MAVVMIELICKKKQNKYRTLQLCLHEVEPL